MAWSPDPDALRGRVAVVTGATRGAGRGIAVALGEHGATVVCTGRSSRTGRLRSDYDRPETIEETAELVSEAGGDGVAEPCDHLDRAQVGALAERLRDRWGHVDVLVDDVWGAETRPRDAPHSPRTTCCRSWSTGVNRLAYSLGHELAAHEATAVALTPGLLRSEMMLEAFGVTEADWPTAVDPSRAERGLPVAPPEFAHSESPRYVGRAIAAIAADPDRSRWNQASATSGEIAAHYGVTDVDGSQPQVWDEIP